MKYSSIFDQPQHELNPLLWEKKEDLYSLKQDIAVFLKEEIHELLNKEFCVPREWIKTIYVHGSNASNQFFHNSDVDVQLEIDMPIFREKNPMFTHKTNEEVLKGFEKSLRHGLKSKTIPNTINKIDLRVLPEKDFVFMGDNRYNVNKNVWEKGPVQVPVGFEPWGKFAKEVKMCRLISRKIYKTLSDLRIAVDFYLKTTRGFNVINLHVKELAFWEQLLIKFRNSRSIEDANFPGPTTSLDWDYRNVIFKIFQSWGLDKPLEKTKEEFPQMSSTLESMRSGCVFPEEDFGFALRNLKDIHRNVN